MAIYSKGSRPYRAAYSPDFTESKVTGLDRDSYDPPLTAAEVRSGKVAVRNWDGGGIDCSSTIDPQVKYGYGFDDNKQANWSADKSADGIGGFSGDLLPGGRGNNQPKRGLKRSDTL